MRLGPPPKLGISLTILTLACSLLAMSLALAGLPLVAATASGVALLAGVTRMLLPEPTPVVPPNDHLVEKAADYAEQSRRLVIYDAGTGLLARWYLELRCQEECYRAARYGELLTLVTFGEGGNAAAPLPERVVGWLRGNVRESDLLGHGGDGRLVVLMTSTGREGARRFAERFSCNFASVRVGRARFPDDGRSLTELMESAAATDAGITSKPTALAA